MNKKHGIFIGFAVLLIAAIFTFTACPTDTDDEVTSTTYMLSDDSKLVVKSDGTAVLTKKDGARINGTFSDGKVTLENGRGTLEITEDGVEGRVDGTDVTGTKNDGGNTGGPSKVTGEQVYVDFNGTTPYSGTAQDVTGTIHGNGSHELGKVGTISADGKLTLTLPATVDEEKLASYEDAKSGGLSMYVGETNLRLAKSQNQNDWLSFAYTNKDVAGFKKGWNYQVWGGGSPITDISGYKWVVADTGTGGGNDNAKLVGKWKPENYDTVAFEFKSDGKIYFGNDGSESAPYNYTGTTLTLGSGSETYTFAAVLSNGNNTLTLSGGQGAAGDQMNGTYTRQN
jgi:hypothetical protein